MGLVRSAFKRVASALATAPSKKAADVVTPHPTAHTRLPLRYSPHLILARHLHSSGPAQSFHESLYPQPRKLTKEHLSINIEPPKSRDTGPKTDPKKQTHQNTTSQPEQQPAIENARHASSDSPTFRRR